MTWAYPRLLALLLLAPLALVAVLVAWRARSRALARIAQVEALRALVRPGVSRARGWQAALGVVAVGGMALAAAGPRLGFDWQQQRMEGVAIVVVLDVSRSMDAQDESPSRMERAHREIADFVALLRGDSVGLVLFAAGAYVRIPLTTDYDTFVWSLQDSDTGTIRAQGSALSGALDAATGMLERAEGTGKAVLLVSDGEFHDDATRIDAATKRAADAGVHLYALGIGDPAGAPIPVVEGGFKKDRNGEVVVSRLDEDRLKSLAAATNGAYVRAVASDADVTALYADEIRGKLEAAERGVRREKVWRERYQWPLALAMLAMAISAAMGIGRRGVALGLVLVVPMRSWAGDREDGLSAFGASDWATAAEELARARVDHPDDVQVGQALAESLYREGRTREAEQMWKSLAEQDAKNRATHLYNAGHAAYSGGRLDDALRHFGAAAEAKMESGTKNAASVEEEIAKRLREPPPEQQPQDDGASDESDPSAGDPTQADAKKGEQGTESPPQDAPSGEQDGSREASQTPGPEGEPSGEMAQSDEGTPDGEALREALGSMTADEAARFVDSVPDGKPRVVVTGRDTEKDW